MPMSRRQKLGGVDLGLQGGCRLLKADKRQAISDSQTELVAMLVSRTMSCPTASRPTASGLTIGSKASRLANKTKGGDRCQPLKPLCRLRYQAQQACADVPAAQQG